MRRRRRAVHASRHESQRRRRLLLGDFGGDGRRRTLPGSEAERREEPRDPFTEVTQNRTLDFIVGQQVHRPVEVHDEPEDDARREDDETSLQDIAAHTVPGMDDDRAEGRQMVGRQLHDERRRVAREEAGLLERDAAENDDRDADDVHERRHIPLLAEEDGGEHRDDHRLGATGDERREDDRHAMVAFVLDRS